MCRNVTDFSLLVYLHHWASSPVWYVHDVEEYSHTTQVASYAYACRQFVVCKRSGKSHCVYLSFGHKSVQMTGYF